MPKLDDQVYVVHYRQDGEECTEEVIASSATEAKGIVNTFLPVSADLPYNAYPKGDNNAS